MEKVILKLRLGIRHIIMSYPGFYKAYYLFRVKPRRKNKKLHKFNLSLKSDLDLYLDGYERSGNTFLKFLIVSLFPDKKILSHLHKVAPLKMMLARKVPTFILIRSPLEAVTSNYFKHFSKTNLPEQVDENVLSLRLQDWIIYYSYVKNNQNRITIIPFEDLVSNDESIMNEFYILFGENKPDNISALVAELEIEFKKKGNGAKEKYGRGYPTREKELKKSELKGFLASSGLFIEAMEIYDHIMRVYRNK